MLFWRDLIRHGISERFTAGWAQALITPAMLADLSGLGGLMIIGIGLDLLRIVEIRTGNMLPGLVLIVLLTALL